MTARDNEKVSDERLIRDLDHAMRTGYIRPMLLTETIEHLRTSQEWVDVRERLPERDGWYLVTATDEHGNGGATHSTYFSRQWVSQGRKKVLEPYWPMNVIAWRELDAPYSPPPKGEAP